MKGVWAGMISYVTRVDEDSRNYVDLVPQQVKTKFVERQKNMLCLV